ncbi:MAG: FAD-dependent oxidoreductase [Candidatus Omnitrophica bacterium]|nr:FAD-dependent oxidoreductase [Candidatus Omnitrophota bacterium]
MTTYDLIIIGAGPAGITAAIYAARKGMKLLVLGKDIGGQALWASDIENYTGYNIITGAELSDKFRKHIKLYGIDAREDETVQSLAKEGGIFTVKTIKGSYNARAVIAASGKTPKRLDVPGEEEFRNKGVAYCATCDGPIFAGKRVCVVGGGNSAITAAIALSKIAGFVSIINNDELLSGDAILQKALEKAGNVKVYNRAVVRAITGNKFVTGLDITLPHGAEHLPLEGVFIEIGLTPNSGFMENIKKNSEGEIEIDCLCRTSEEGLFAAGDVTNVPEKQIIVAAGEGAKAALSAFRYIVSRFSL